MVPFFSFFIFTYRRNRIIFQYMVFQESCEFSFTYSTQLSNQENKMQLTNKISLTKNSYKETKTQLKLELFSSHSTHQ